MNAAERVMKLCKERGIAVSRLEKDLGFSNAYFRGLKKGYIPSDRLYRIAEYLDVSPEYIATGEEPDKAAPVVYFLQRETAEIAQELHDRPELYMIFKTLRKASPESLKLTAEVIERIAKADSE